MIIYGYRERAVDVATGEFYCPRCQARRAFKHKRMLRYFTLFFIPLFPLGRLGEYVECQTCFTTHNTSVLDSSAAEQAVRAGAALDLLEPASIRPVLPDYTRRGWTLALLGAGIFLCAGVFGLLMIIGQFASEAGPGDNLQGFIGLFLLCPTPIMALGIAGLLGGFYILGKNKQKTDAGA
jgi:hypothetical protein